MTITIINSIRVNPRVLVIKYFSSWPRHRAGAVGQTGLLGHKIDPGATPDCKVRTRGHASLRDTAQN